MPKLAPFGFIRTPIAMWCVDASGAATVAPDFAANTGATVFGGTAGFIPGYKVTVEKLRLILGDTDWAGTGGDLTFELRVGTTTGTVLATLRVQLANAKAGAVLEATVAGSVAPACCLDDTSKLFLMRKATGTVFTTGQGTWQIIGRQKPQQAS